LAHKLAWNWRLLQWRAWNWKTAALGSSGRVALFGLAFIHSSRASAAKSMLVELLLTAALGGFQGAILQAMRHLEPPWRASFLSLAAISLVVHPSEFLVHTLLGNSRAHAGIAFSFLFTVFASQLSLCLMRRGLFITGASGRPFWRDLGSLLGMLAGRRV